MHSKKRLPRGLYFITDRALSKDTIFSDAKTMIAAGAKAIQYREKDLPTKVMVEEAAKLKQICEERALFIVNDRVDIALAADADGVHLGQSDMPPEKARELLGAEKVIGLSTHSIEEALKAEQLKIDYISVGPVFHTNTKRNAGSPVGVSMVSKAKKALSLPVVAVGGINEGNLDKVLAAKPDAVAMVSGLLCNNSLLETAKRIVRKIDDAIGNR